MSDNTKSNVVNDVGCGVSAAVVGGATGAVVAGTIGVASEAAVVATAIAEGSAVVTILEGVAVSAATFICTPAGILIIASGTVLGVISYAGFRFWKSRRFTL